MLKKTLREKTIVVKDNIDLTYKVIELGQCCYATFIISKIPVIINLQTNASKTIGTEEDVSRNATLLQHCYSAVLADIFFN